MEPKVLGASLAGLVAGVALARLLFVPATGRPDGAAAATPTPFVCARIAESPDAEIAAHRGHVTLFVNWSSLDPAWLPLLEHWRSTYASRGLRLVGVLPGKSEAEVTELCRVHRLRWPQIHSTSHSPWSELFRNTIFAVVDARGEVRHRGWIDASTQGKIEEALAGEKREVRGRLLHRGRPLSNFTEAEPKLTVRNALYWTDEPDPVEYFRATGSFVLRIAPGTYLVNAELPGFLGAKFVGVPDYPSSDPIDVDIRRRLRLRTPIDSDVPQPGLDKPLPFHASPIAIEWDPVPGADTYRWSAWGTASASDDTEAPRASLTLPPGEYAFLVLALEKDEIIGQLQITYDSSKDSAYRFRVPPR